jgi:hypothetical protein
MYSTITSFLAVRVAQIKRIIAATGYLHTLFYVGLFALLLLVSYEHVKLFPNVFFVAGAVGACMAYIQLTRTDKTFVFSITEHARWVFFAEYLLLSLPFILLMLATPHGYVALMLLLFLYACTFLNIRFRKRAGSLLATRYLPAYNFEWIAGVRANFWVLVPLYILAVGLMFIKFASLALVWVLMVLIASFYQHCEPVNVLQLPELPPKLFLLQKLRSHLLLYLVLVLPVLVGYAVFNPDTAWVALLFLLMSSINVCFFILSKYALYTPNSKLTANQVLVSLALFSILIPFLLPLPLIMCIRNYFKAKNNLNYYLDAYN